MLEEAFRSEWARVVASLVRVFGDIDVAEEAAQEAFSIAAVRWQVDGPPDEPRAWLVTTGRNRAIDRLRRDRLLAEKARLLEIPPPAPVTLDSWIRDDRLELVFMCCHPVLPVEARVALTLRAVGGLSTAEIARAFLLSDDAMKRRLTRARQRIRTAAVPFAIPDHDMLLSRVDAVLAVLYLIFNQGYGDGRPGLAGEAIRMGRILVETMADESRAVALLALMLLQDARRDARVRDRMIVPLADQDRNLWNAAQIGEGSALLRRATALGERGPYAVQAAIAMLHIENPIDWPSVARLYETLNDLVHSPVVELNRAVAVAQTRGPLVALQIVDSLDLADYRYFHSTRAELLRRLGDLPGARTAYRRALDLSTTDVERSFLRRRLTEL